LLSAYWPEQRPGAEPGLLDDEIAPKQPLAELPYGGVQTVPLKEMFFRAHAQQHKPRHRHLQAEDKLAKILILRQQHPAVALGTPDYFGVART
jgi:hypothetical protein